MSTSAVCSASRSGWWNGRIAAASPMRTRRVREAATAASVPGSTASP